MSEELKACPFCGGTITGLWDNKGVVHVICGICNTTGPMGDDDDDATLAWNTRHQGGHDE